MDYVALFKWGLHVGRDSELLRGETEYNIKLINE